jgi:glycosyltransferase involved in cell wall biosynthesis
MKIGIVIENYVAGGSDVVAREIANNDQKNSYVVIYNSRNDDRNLLSFNCNVKYSKYYSVTPAEFSHYVNNYIKNRFFRMVLKISLRPIVSTICLLEVFFLLLRHKVEILVSNNGGYPGGEITRLIPLVSYISPIRSFALIHNMPTPPKLFYISRCIDSMLSLVTVYITVSNQIKNNLMITRGIKAITLHNSHFFKKLKSPSLVPISEINVNLWIIASISPIKNHINLIAKLDKLDMNVREKLILNIVGFIDSSDEYTKSLQSAALVAKVKVVFHDFVQDFSYPRYKYNFLILNSTREGLPLVILEAFAQGVPVIVPDIGGISEVMTPGYSGCLFKNNKEFFEFFNNFFNKNYSELYTLMSNYVYNYADKEFSTKSYIAKYQRIIKK